MRYTRSPSSLDSYGSYVPPAVYDAPETCRDPERCRMKPSPYRCVACFNWVMGSENASPSKATLRVYALLRQNQEAASRKREIFHPGEPRHITRGESNSTSIEPKEKSSAPSIELQIMVERRREQHSITPPEICEHALNDTMPIQPMHTITHSTGWTPINCDCAGCHCYE